MKSQGTRLPVLISILVIVTFLVSCAPAATATVAPPPAVAPTAAVAPTVAPAASAATEAPTSQPVCTTPTKMRVVLNWQPQTEHAGLYMALWKGFYKDLCVDMTIDPGGPQTSASIMVASGTDDFGIAEPHVVVIGESKKLPFVTVMQFQHGSYLAYIAKKSSGIKTIQDVKGKTVALWLGGGEYEFLAMLASQGISEKDVNIVAEQDAVAPFLAGKVDVTEVTLQNELHQIYNTGVKPEDLTIMTGADYGVNLVADGLFTRQDVIDKNPTAVQAVVTATIEGWQYAAEHPEETTQAFVSHFPELNYNDQLYMLQVMNKLLLQGNGTSQGIGYIDPQYFETAQKVMTLNKLLDGPVTLQNCYNQTFWNNAPAAYKKVSQ